MAVKIQLFQRAATPPGATSTPKPSFALADRSGEQAVNKAFADTASDDFTRLVKARANNEEAQFENDVKLAQQEFDTYVASKPGDSFEEVKVQRDKMLADIKKAGGKATTTEAQTNNANWFTANFETLKEQSETSMIATRTNQALKTADLIADNYKNNLDKVGLGIFTSQQVAAGLWEETGAKARLQTEFDVIDAAQSKIDVQNASQIGFDAWELTGDKEDTLRAIEGLDGLTGDQKQIAESKALQRIGYREGEEELQLEADREEDLDGINKLMYTDKNYTAAAVAVEASSLPEREQGRLLSEIDQRSKLAAKSTPEVDDPEAVDKVSTAITRVGSDLMDIRDAKQVLRDNQHLLKGSTAAAFYKDINEEFDASTSISYARVRRDTRSKAIGKSESALDVLLGALAGVAPKDEKELIDRIATAREKFNLELENFNMWESAMRDWRRSNLEASPEDIQKEGLRSWNNNFSGLSVEQLRTRSGTEKALSIQQARASKAKNTKTAPAKQEDPVPVKVVDPQGRTGTIMSDNLEAAIKAGWKKL